MPSLPSERRETRGVKVLVKIERIETNSRMSKIVLHNDVVYLCGQVGSGSTAAAQTADCLARIEALLVRAGSSKRNILQAIIWLSDMNDFDEINTVWDKWLPEGAAPVRACGEARLAEKNLRIEIIVTAARDFAKNG